MAEATIRFTKRPNAEEKKLLEQIRAEIKENGDEGTYRADNLEDLKAVVEGIRAKRFKQESQNNNVEKSNENNTMSKSAEPSEPKVEQPIVESKPETNSMGDDFSFLNQPLVDRTYSGTDNIPNNPYLGQDVPEAVVKNPIEQMMDEERAENEENAQEEGQKEESSSFSNPDLKGLDDKTKRQAAESLADLTYEALKGIHTAVISVTKISEKKVDKLVMSGEIDPQMVIQTEQGDLTFPDYVNSYNNQVEQSMAYDPTIEEQTRKPLVNVFMKHDVGVTDEQQLIGFGLLYVGRFVSAGVQLKSYSNMVLDGMKNATKREREITQPPVSPDIITKQNESTTTHTPKRQVKSSRGKTKKSIQQTMSEAELVPIAN